jgi:hypothetical protein
VADRKAHWAVIRCANELLNPQVNPVHRRKKNDPEKSRMTSRAWVSRQSPEFRAKQNVCNLRRYHSNREEILARRYGMTREQYHEMREKQNGCCALCDMELIFSGSKRNSAFIDHDHVTDRVRGFLCLKCNIGLGYFDNIEWLERVKKYLGEVKENG